MKLGVSLGGCKIACGWELTPMATQHDAPISRGLTNSLPYFVAAQLVLKEQIKAKVRIEYSSATLCAARQIIFPCSHYQFPKIMASLHHYSVIFIRQYLTSWLQTLG
jgi:hypothetical protein